MIARVECRFLEEVMKNIGFCNKWIQIVKRCLSSVNIPKSSQ